jgi:hypothetical protein
MLSKSRNPQQIAPISIPATSQPETQQKTENHEQNIKLAGGGFQDHPVFELV